MSPISEKYKVGLTITTNGRVDCLTQAAASLKEMILDHWDFDFKCVIDDSGDQNNFHYTRELLPNFTYIRNIENIGLANTVQTVWQSVPSDIKFILHVEDDFIYNEVPRLDNMVSIMADDQNKSLWQLMLKRQPVSSEEVAAGGFIGLAPDLYYPNMNEYLEEIWLEHQQFFSLNPSIIPRKIFRDIGWPHGNEAEMNDTMRNAGGWSAVLGSKESDPVLTHIGHYRSEHWKL